ncbi:MAG: hypothetical protein COX57_05925 [Alphaproteobacteria bacterium CG_4_10_14_0_2_um_filter_63_37]|nr:MAG: hypothetical protein AUJ55_07015 [Proteobacteria bacterium CG1_02_64_396]PJA24853.1 MAG: hypothetical protein COX57_05925 [Alphaproteobacteria bacterium CG_4_10_14_0_2_um_filter_63_37]
MRIDRSRPPRGIRVWLTLVVVMTLVVTAMAATKLYRVSGPVSVEHEIDTLAGYHLLTKEGTCRTCHRFVSLRRLEGPESCLKCHNPANIGAAAGGYHGDAAHRALGQDKIRCTDCHRPHETLPQRAAFTSEDQVWGHCVACHPKFAD